jgi:hypothetical protein
MMPLLITMWLFVDGLHSIFVIATLLSHVVVAITSNLLWIEFAPIVVTIIQVVAATSLIIDLV